MNLKFDEQNCLHLLLNSLTNDNIKDVSTCVMLMLMHGCSPNMPDKNLKTPFYLLLENQSKAKEIAKLVKFFLSHGEIDFHTYRSRELNWMIEMSQKDFAIPDCSKVINVDFMMTLLHDRKELDFEIYFKAFEETADNKLPNYCIEFLEKAVTNNLRDTVEFLVAKPCVDVNAKPVAFMTCASGNYQILGLLLKRRDLEFTLKNSVKSYTLLHEICQNFTVKIRDQNFDYQKCFELVLKDPRCDVNAEDDLKCIPLHYTLHFQNDGATLALLKRGSYINKVSSFGRSPIDEISRTTLEKFLDECITSRAIRNKGYQPDVCIDYNFLIAPSQSHCKELQSEISPLKRITNNKELRDLVNHPVLSSFLYLKWSKLKSLFYINLAITSLFMIAFMTFIVLCQIRLNRSNGTDQAMKEDILYDILYRVSIFSIALLMLRELFHCILGCKDYLTSLINWFEVFLIILACYVFAVISEHESAVQRNLRAILILGTAFEFLRIIGQLPDFSISTHMVILKRVTITFLKSIALYSILLLSFGLSFFILFSDTNETENVTQDTNGIKNVTNDDSNVDFKHFNSVGISFVRVFVMLTGEFDASDLKLNSNVACVIFTLCVFLITIVLYNLLNALAVSDTQALKAEGETIDFFQRIQVIESYERIIKNTGLKLSWISNYFNLFPSTIPEGKIIIRSRNSNEIIPWSSDGNTANTLRNTMTISSTNSEKRSFRRVWFKEPLERLQRVPNMKTSIMHKMKNILATREQSKIAEMNMATINNNISSIKRQLNIQMQLITELSSKLN